ncbi:hypothetical protein ASF53_05125 [Methylobacterium sp. Leaf123]|uniref:hypothetical protein n=1 Tax=Methylobacterium sp. Leaf123 TaxID=1736264 RepID=UPI0006FB7324|nr:hypothetical protein [Methylobacterium sp. Leaf123]KQQ23709.1 hypothetical protein ASF53_05125 [Methylobacterium sp. Leaf123]
MRTEVDHLTAFQADCRPSAGGADFVHLARASTHKGTTAIGFRGSRGIDPRIDPPVEPAQEGGEDARDHPMPAHHGG